MLSESQLELIHKELMANGYCIHSTAHREEAAVVEYHWNLVNQLGEPLEHNAGKEDYIWRVQPTVNDSKLKTFSEHAGEADLHTDTQYRRSPERYMSLSMVRDSACGGGQTILLDYKKVADRVAASPYYAELTSDYPIMVPDVFSANESKVIYAPILADEPLLRFRDDTISKGLDAINEPLDSPKRQAFEWLRDELFGSEHIVRFHLEPGQILVIDNHRVMHGRSAFQDPDRLLFRIRFN